MTRGALARLAAASAALFAAVALANEPEPGGHRQSVDVRAYPWSSVAKLYNGTGAACTAVVIDQAQVLTAAHCLFNRRTGRFVAPGSLHVLLGYERGDYRVHARAARYRIGSGYDPTKPETLAADWAVLTLADALPAEIRPLRLGLLPPAGTPIRTAGYAQDRAYAMTADTACRILGATTGLLVHDCRTRHGNSGAPLLAGAADGSAEILGLSVAGARRSGVPVTVAVPAARIARELAQTP